MYYESRSCQLTRRPNVKSSSLKIPLTSIKRPSQTFKVTFKKLSKTIMFTVSMCVCICEICLRACAGAALSLRHALLTCTLNVTLCRCATEYNGAVCSAWKNMLLAGESQGVTHRPKLSL